MRPLRVAVIGARRQAQGIGEFVARDLAQGGAEVAAVAGTRPETVEEARATLRSRYGLNVRGYASVGEMLARESLEAVAICSPQQFHRAHLELALQHRLHALCEKPLVFEEGRDNAADVERLVAAFRHERRWLVVNEPWPYTLPCFDRVWPGVRDPHQSPRRLAMLLCPPEQGAAMIPNALPHVLSVLLALAPAGGEAREICIHRPEAAVLDVRFAYVHGAGETSVSARFLQRRRQPRPAGYAIDGYGVRRGILLPEYTMFFEGRRIEQEEEFWRFVVSEEPSGNESLTPIDDPLPLLVADFVRRVQSINEQEGAAGMVDSARALAEIYGAASRGA